ncbi:MAG TPA: hypothetical protein VK617_11000 [Gemmatimonadaceae bacterium]|nr:hypothetical protein [Gemmatimonadaceae bacterium]
MRRELIMCCTALAMMGSVSGCRQSAEARAQNAAARAQNEAAVRQSATVQRLATPTDSGRILYTAPPSLADSNARAAPRPFR